jgi:hypothetical protein
MISSNYLTFGSRPTSESTRGERKAFYQIGEDKDESHAIERSGLNELLSTDVRIGIDFTGRPYTTFIAHC